METSGGELEETQKIFEKEGKGGWRSASMDLKVTLLDKYIKSIIRFIY